MTDKKKITLIYVGVAVISVMILGMSFFLTGLRKVKEKQTIEQAPPATGVGKEFVDEMMVLDSDIELERQDGAKVKLSDLKDKVWLAAQFYASCPECAKRNQSSLLEIYREFKDEKEFIVACFSVDPEHDTQELLADLREAMGLEKDSWWFLRAERQKLWDFMTEEMYFTTILERPDPIEAAAKGKYMHDLGYQLYRGNTLVHKWDQGLPLDQLRDEIKEALRELREGGEENDSASE